MTCYKGPLAKLGIRQVIRPKTNASEIKKGRVNNKRPGAVGPERGRFVGPLGATTPRKKLKKKRKTKGTNRNDPCRLRSQNKVENLGPVKVRRQKKYVQQ